MNEVRTRHELAPVAAAEAGAELIAVIVAVTDGEPRVLTIENGQALPSGPFELDTPLAAVGHALLGGATDPPSAGLCGAALHLRRPRPDTRRPRMVSISYLGLAREARAAGEPRRGLAELVSLLSVGGSPRGLRRSRSRSPRTARLGERCRRRGDPARAPAARSPITFGHDGAHLERGADPAAL